MYVTITEEVSIEVQNKFDFVSQRIVELKSYFNDKFYGDDLRSIYIGMVCISPKFESFFKSRRPKYATEGKIYDSHGVQIISEGMSLEYDLKLDYNTYLNAENPQLLFAGEVLKSLEVIKTIKRIKDFDYDSFRRDFEGFFWNIGWFG